MSESKNRSARLSEISRVRSAENRVYSLSVFEGETCVLSPSSSKMREHFERIDLSSVDELKELIGVPRTLRMEPRSPALDRLRRPTARPARVSVEPLRLAAGRVVFDQVEPIDEARENRLRVVERMFSRTIDPSVFDKDDDDPERMAAVQIARATISDYIYSNAAITSQARELVTQYLGRRTPQVLVAVFADIQVANGATLQVSAGTLAVHANRVRLYGTGQIVCDGPTTFDVKNVRGNIQPVQWAATSELTLGPIASVFD